MTYDVNEYYGVNIRHGEKIGARRWRSEASIFRRDTQKEIEKLYAEGGTMGSAESNALSEAKIKIASLSIPPGWRGHRSPTK